MVPAISVTMALSSPKSTFIREDFPAFGFPKITVLMPSDMTRPSSQEAKSRSTCFTIGSKAAKRRSGYPSNEICSGSSKADSIKAISYKIFSRSSRIFRETEPASWLTELFKAYSLVDWITSATASAWAKSIRPFKKARFVNSPGSAVLAPFRITVSKIFFTIKTPPWQSISTVSSAV